MLYVGYTSASPAVTSQMPAWLLGRYCLKQFFMAGGLDGSMCATLPTHSEFPLNTPGTWVTTRWPASPIAL